MFTPVFIINDNDNLINDNLNMLLICLVQPNSKITRLDALTSFSLINCLISKWYIDNRIKLD